jgi:hypothetical protein
MTPDSGNSTQVNCSEFEILLCDYLDGTLDAQQKQALEAHRQGCAACAEFAREVTGAVEFIQRAEDVSPPQELLTRIAFEIPSGKPLAAGAEHRLFQKWLKPVLQPRFAMGFAMTILSFSMVGRFAGIDVRQLKPSDLSPVKVWAAADDRVHRSWERAVKYYESLRLVYEVQSRLKEWTDQDEEDQRGQPVGAPVSQPAASGNQTTQPAEGQSRK